jgi:DNA-binding protein WhiA
MSFSSGVKRELCGIEATARHCLIAEIAAIINTCGFVERGSVWIQSENAPTAKNFYTLMKKTFDVNLEIVIRKSKKFKKGRLYCVNVSSPHSERVLKATGLYGAPKRIDPLLVSASCCKRAYIRGAFLSGGSVSDPEKTYHCEFVNSDYELSRELSGLINYFGLNSKIIERKGHFVVYLKEGENIVDLLNIMEAHNSLMRMENLRIIKDMRNSVNRIVNCETANLNKTVKASVKQIEDIEYVSVARGLGSLSEQLREVAELRLTYQDATLKEIGEMLNPPVGKSGVNHRLRRITEIAENLRGGQL